MSEQLRDVLTRIAEQAAPGVPDPTLWARARRARRRAEIVTAAAVGAAVFTLAAITGLLLQPPPDRADPSPTGRPGIPSVVRGVAGDGGLELETDLAVGAASVAIANPTGAFVVTADDGLHHRLDLPGFDPQVYDDPEVRRTGMVGLSLSPDGTRLAYGWHAPLPDETGQERGFVRSGLRILDLRTGEVDDVPEDREPPAEFGAFLPTHWGVVPYGPRWSASGRYLAYDQVWAGADAEAFQWANTLDQAYRHSITVNGAAVYDTATGIRHDVFDRPSDDRESWLGSYMIDWPPLVSDDGTLVKVGINNTITTALLDGHARDERDLPGGPANDVHTAGLVDDQRVVVETRTPSSQLLAIDLRTGASERLELPLTPVHVDLLGWIGADHAMAQVRQGSEQNLIVLDLSDADVETDLAAPFDDEGTDSSFSFATDFATVRHPTAVFTEASDSDDGSADAPPPGAGDTATGPDPAWLLAGLGAGVLAAGLTMAARRRRIRVD